MNIKKILAGGLILASLFGVVGLAKAAGYDWRYIARDNTDSTDLTIAAPQVPQHTFAAFGKGYNSGTGVASDPAWYYFSSPIFNISTNTTDGIGGNYNIGLDLGGVNPLDIGNLGDLLDTKASAITVGNVVSHSINGHFLGSDITITKANVGLGNVDNTSDSNKPISTATQTALNAKGIGTVTSVVAGTGLNGGTITSTGTISLPNVGTAASYGGLTTDAQGRVTAAKRQETYSGTTNGSGVYTVTFGTAYSVAPNIQANIINPTDTQSLRITAVSTTGFTVLARNRTDTLGLLPSYANLASATVDVLVTEK